MGTSAKARWLILGLVGAFVSLRIILWFSPNSDFDVLGHNIHHLFTGLLLITLASPIAIFGVQNQALMNSALITLGMGLGITLDEWVYLIVTNGSNDSYLLPISFWGGLVAVSLAVFWIHLVARFIGRD